MAAASQIQYTPHHEIDTIKWDACVAATKKSLIYNNSWFLDAMAAHWDGLVMNDYEAVMPLTWNKKYGFHYLYQPFFTAQIGISGNQIDGNCIDAFLRAIPAHFKFIDINLDEKNRVSEFSIHRRERVNMLLDISPNYEEVQENYHRLAARMIKKSVAENIHIEEGASIASSIAFFRQHYHSQMKIPQQSYENLEKMFELASDKKQLISLEAKKDNTLLGVYLLLLDDNYVYSVIGGSSPEGKKAGAFYLLTDYAIEMMAGSNHIFRFEGSDIEGVADFNKQFGPSVFYYDHIKINKLPYPLRLFKR